MINDCFSAVISLNEMTLLSDEEEEITLEDDVDSNAEDHYLNDYPDEEGSSDGDGDGSCDGYDSSNCSHDWDCKEEENNCYSD